MNMRQKMRSLLKEKDYVFSFGIHNPMQAIIAERVGFDSVYMGGYDTTVGLLGFPDVGLITETEMVTNARNIANAVNVPLLADAETGYGNVVNVTRTVRDYEAAGVAGIHIEDTVGPSRHGHLAGKMIIPIEEVVGKIKAALDARKDKDFLIIGRTDAIGAVGGGFEEALKRGKEYARVGADMVLCIFGSPDIEHPKKFAEEMHKEFPALPLHFNYASAFKWYESPLKFSEIGRMGYKVINVAIAGLRVSMKAVWDYAVDLKKREEQAELDFEKSLIGHPVENFGEFSGLSKIMDLESKYLPGKQ